MKPFLKWAGGKSWLVPSLVEMCCTTRRMVEPFCGAISVTLGIMPGKALLNDLNPYLINLYQQVQLNGELEAFENTAEAYYEARDEMNLIGPRGRKSAALFYYLNRHGFNGLCRFNSRGKFNVPYGKYKSPVYTPDLSEYTKAFQTWEFTNVDFEDVPVGVNDFVYIDPPYVDGFTSYTEPFTWTDQRRLADWASRQGKITTVVASNKATEEIYSLYKKLGFDIRIMEAPRRISANGNREPVSEMLAVKQP